MIYIFNESDSAIWEVREKNEFFYHIGLVNSRFGIDILKRDIDTSEFIVNSLNTPGKLMVLSSNSFNVCYNNKSGLPFLKSVVNVNDYSQDLYILSYKIPEKMETVFEKNGKFNILYTKFDSKSNISQGLIYVDMVDILFWDNNLAQNNIVRLKNKAYNANKIKKILLSTYFNIIRHIFML